MIRVMLCFLFVSFGALANDRFANVVVKSTPLNGGVHMLVGSGGNIGVFAGEDGILIVDDQFAPMASKIDAAIKAISPSTLRYVINTHYHGDHTGGNAPFKMHHDATIFAHENVRIRLAAKADVEKKALPVVTYQDGIKFHFNDSTVHVWHVSNSHTDGDSVVWFEEQNVLHAGDLFFNKWFPYVDLDADGSVSGLLSSLKALQEKVNDETRIIPGHGPLATKADLTRYIAMIEATSTYVAMEKARGSSLEALIAKGLEDKWKVWAWDFITEEKWITTLYNSQ